MGNKMKPSLGWDLAGYGDSGSALCRADRTGDTITAAVLRAPFICRPRHKITASIHATADTEVEMLRRFASIGNTYLDVPVDLQLLGRLVDHLQNEQATYYWQLVKRPVDHIFKALEPLASNLGFAVARTSHILGRLASEGAGLKLGENLFETYPAATLQLVWDTNNWTEAKYKGGAIAYHNGKWQGKPAKTKSEKSRMKEERKNAGLGALATQLRFDAPEGSEMDDDEFDAALCAVTGCIPDCAVHRESLSTIIRHRLRKGYGQAEWIANVEPPEGYVVFDRLPENIQIRVRWIECATPESLFSALCR